MLTLVQWHALIGRRTVTQLQEVDGDWSSAGEDTDDTAKNHQIVMQW